MMLFVAAIAIPMTILLLEIVIGWGWLGCGDSDLRKADYDEGDAHDRLAAVVARARQPAASADKVYAVPPFTSSPRSMVATAQATHAALQAHAAAEADVRYLRQQLEATRRTELLQEQALLQQE